MKLAVLALGFGLMAAFPSGAVAAQTDESQMVDPAPFVSIVRDYVKETRHWTEDQYTVRFSNWRDDGTLSFSVAWKWPPSRVPVPGDDGKSFYAVVDPKTRKVIKELQGQ